MSTNHPDDLESLNTCFAGWDLELIRLSPRQVTGGASLTMLSSSRVIRVHGSSAVVIRGTTPGVSGCMLLSASPEVPVRLLGQSMDASQFALAGRGSRIEAFLPSDATLCLIVAESLASLSPRRVQLHTANVECVAALMRCVQAVTHKNAARSRSGAPRTREEMLIRQMRIAMEASTAADAVASPASQRATAVASARRFIDSHLGKPIRLDDLCQHCKVGVRTLEYGFRQFYDTTPVGFIKSQRLTRTYQALSNLDVKSPSISHIARRMGFTHMGQFAQDYRALFGESPSTTRQRTWRRSMPAEGNDAPAEDRSSRV